MASKKARVSEARAHDKVLKEDTTRRRVGGRENSSQDTDEEEDSEREEALARAFGVRRDRGEEGVDEGSADVLVEHRRREREWRERHVK